MMLGDVATNGEDPGGGPRHVLVINPNTNPAVTRRIQTAAIAFETDRVRLHVVNPSEGPFSIETAVDRMEAERHAVSLFEALAPQRFVACVMACFDDLALDLLRSRTASPVIGTCEAGIAAARSISPRLAIITTFEGAVPGIRELMKKYGAGPSATVRAAGVGVAAAASAASQTIDRIIDCARRAVDEDGAEVLLLASGGLTGMGPTLSNALNHPVVDGVVEAIRAAVREISPIEAQALAASVACGAP